MDKYCTGINKHLDDTEVYNKGARPKINFSGSLCGLNFKFDYVIVFTPLLFLSGHVCLAVNI